MPHALYALYMCPSFLCFPLNDVMYTKRDLCSVSQNLCHGGYEQISFLILFPAEFCQKPCCIWFEVYFTYLKTVETLKLVFRWSCSLKPWRSSTIPTCIYSMQDVLPRPWQTLLSTDYIVPEQKRCIYTVQKVICMACHHSAWIYIYSLCTSVISQTFALCIHP